MARIQSKFPEIRQIVLNAFPTRPIQMDRSVKVSDMIIGVGKNGKIYVSGIKQNSHYHENMSKIRTIIRGLATLGAIPKDVYREYEKAAEEFGKKEHQAYCASAVMRQMKELGIKLTSAQQVRLANIGNTAASVQQY